MSAMILISGGNVKILTLIWWFTDTFLVIKTPFKPIQALALKQLLKIGSQNLEAISRS